jgi:hypothetical protein
MAQPIVLRRFADNVLISNICVEFSGYRWEYIKPIHRTLTMVSIPQQLGGMERWWDAAFEFASDDAVNTLARYDAMALDANRDEFFKFIDMHNITRKCRIMAPPEVERLEVPDADVLTVRATFKEDGHIPA